MKQTIIPPPVIGNDRVISYAIVDDAVEFTGRQCLYVNDNLLGKVPKIAICRSLGKKITDHLIMFCSDTWQLLGVSGAPSLDEAKKKVARYYIGLNWVDINTSKKEAVQWLKENFPEETCSFCGRFFFEIEAGALFHSPRATICLSCAEMFVNDFKDKHGGN
jgi:hypothetical protein